jgi:hypothetical protein
MISLDFKDEDGNSHTVVYDSVLALSPIPGSEHIEVSLKVFPRMLDNLPMHSDALKDKGYKHSVYSDMYKRVFEAKASQKKILGKRTSVQGSCAVKCSDSVFQGMIYTLAEGEECMPFIFNNTCYSWGEIAANFLDAGACGYIGTMWNVGNKEAIAFSKQFYANAGLMAISQAILVANGTIQGTRSENIYIFWGLHFTKLARPIGHIPALVNMVSTMMKTLRYHVAGTKYASSDGTRKSHSHIANWIYGFLTPYQKIVKALLMIEKLK